MSTIVPTFSTVFSPPDKASTASFEKRGAFNYSVGQSCALFVAILGDFIVATDRTCGKILVHSCRHHGCSSLVELARAIEMQIGELCESYYRPCSITGGYKGTRKSGYERIVIEELQCDSLVSDSFRGRNVVFTGTLISMTRQVAAQMVIERGGSVFNSVRKDTNLLVMGLQDYSRFTDGQASNKTKKAKELIAQGKPLEIIDENEFLRRLLQEGCQ
jgi:DNA polymerase-3 subunit epsilon